MLSMGGVVRCELYMYFECVFHVFITQMLDSHLIHQCYTNLSFYNVLQIEKSSKGRVE